MLIRVQSPDGTQRIEIDENEKLSSLFLKIKEKFRFNLAVTFKLFKEKGNKSEILNESNKTLKQSVIKHGQMLFLDNVSMLQDECSNIVKASTSKSIISDSNQASTSLKNNNSNFKSILNEEDEVDIALWKNDGLIERKQDQALCKHGLNAKCINCMPLEPFDPTYLKENNIKHLSFHSYLRKQTRGIDNGKFAVLENLSCKIKEGCLDHLPWPKGICTKCQPTAVTLSRQTYRHVDNVVFENTAIVEQFLNYWRSTGHQRIGFLYGNYESNSGVPLGIKANVLAIYEPPQESSSNYIKLTLPDKNENLVKKIADKLGLKCIGWIFTDLISQDSSKGLVKHLRNIDNYFLTAQECIMAGHFQTLHPNICRLSNDGYFGSKFVTVIVTGDKENQIHMEGYQVSNQCMALVRDNCLLPTIDAPELAFVKETSKEQYVPDVFFTEKDKFNNEIKQVARLLPIEYLLVDVPVSTPLEQKYTFNCNRKFKSFAIENRALQNHLQDFTALSNYLDQFKNKKEEFLNGMKDFHLLIYLATMDMISFKNDIDNLLEAIKSNDFKKAIDWSQNENWATLEQLIEAQNSSNIQTNNTVQETNSTTVEKWSCEHCTFENSSPAGNCEMCRLPKQYL